MRPDNIFYVELMEDLRHRRGLALKIALPIILIIPLTFDQVSESFRTAGLALIVLFLGVLGTSVGLSGMKEKGILERLTVLPLPRGRVIRDFLMANIAMDLVQITIPFIILVLSFRLHADSLFLSAGALVLSVFFANSMGVLVAIASSGPGETHLYSAICVLLVAGFSGVFSASFIPALDVTSHAMPFGILTQSLSEAASFKFAGPLLGSVLLTFLAATAAIVLSARQIRR